MLRVDPERLSQLSRERTSLKIVEGSTRNKQIFRIHQEEAILAAKEGLNTGREIAQGPFAPISCQVVHGRG